MSNTEPASDAPTAPDVSTPLGGTPVQLPQIDFSPTGNDLLGVREDSGGGEHA